MPPRGSCCDLRDPTEEQVELSSKGTVTTFCVVNLPFYGQAVEIPYVCAAVVLDGADLPFSACSPSARSRTCAWACASKRSGASPRAQAVAREHQVHAPTGEPDAPYESFKEHL